MPPYDRPSTRHSSAHHCHRSSPSSSTTRRVSVWRKSRSTTAASRAAQARTRHASKPDEARDRHQKAILERRECAKGRWYDSIFSALNCASRLLHHVYREHFADVSRNFVEQNYIVNLDARALRNPTTKKPLTIPRSKPHLATALALEWDLLVSAQQATRSHLIPLTSISARAHVLGLEDRENQHTISPGTGIRYDIINTLLRYLDTDTLLCWAPASTATNPSDKDVKGELLRDLQVRTAKPILSYLTQNVWPGVELKPALDNGSILPASQPAATRAVIKGWMAGLPAWELVGLERAALAGKSLCVAARLVCEWSEYLKLGDMQGEAVGRFGIEEAAKACSQEVIWQTGRWGEVEDSHDVDKEDLRRQFGSVVLVVSGMGNTTQT